MASNYFNTLKNKINQCLDMDSNPDTMFHGLSVGNSRSYVEKYGEIIDKMGVLEDNLDETSKGFFVRDNTITYIIGNTLCQLLISGMIDEDTRTIDFAVYKIDEETRRLEALCEGIDTHYDANITKSKAKEILERYFTEREVDDQIIGMYPDTLKITNFREIYRQVQEKKQSN